MPRISSSTAAMTSEPYSICRRINSSSSGLRGRPCRNSIGIAVETIELGREFQDHWNIRTGCNQHEILQQVIVQIVDGAADDMGGSMAGRASMTVRRRVSDMADSLDSLVAVLRRGVLERSFCRPHLDSRMRFGPVRWRG